VIAANSSNHIVYVNQSAEQLLGWPDGALIGQSLAVIQPARLRDAHAAGFRRFLDTGQGRIVGRPVHVPALHRDGSEIDIELSVTCLMTAEGPVVVASLRDLRVRVELERQIEMTRYLRATAEAASELSSLLDFDRVLEVVARTLVTDFNAALARIWLAEPTSRTLYLRAEAGTAEPPDGDDREQLHYEALPIWIDHVARTRTPFVENRLRGDPGFDQAWVAREQIAAVAAFPLIIASEVQGVMVHYSHESFPDELIEILTSFAAVVTASLNDVQLFVREQEARSDAETAQRRFAFLAEASRVLANSLEYETTLQSLAGLVVPHLADWCIVDVVGRDGEVRRVAVAHSDPARMEMAREYQRQYPPTDRRDSSVAEVIRTGMPSVIREIPTEALHRVARDAQHLEIIRGLGLTSYMCVPLVAHGRVRGAITFILAESARCYGDADLVLAEDLARRAAIAVDNAYLYQELQQALRVRDEFLTSVSHDLKNPIAAIKGRAQMLERRLPSLPPEEAERFAQGLENIDAGASRMTRFINDLVDVTRLRIGQPLELDRRKVDLVELVRQVVEHQKGIGPQAIRLKTQCEQLAGVWDGTRLERTVGNLVSNAAKYSPDGKEIVVEIDRKERPAGSVAVLAVRDQGIGIPATDLPYIFERFHRAGNVVGKFEGTGVGLAAARQIVEQHGGTLAVQSVENEGTTFTIELPLG
jgi:PAS domain S-box-containing protein